MLARARAAGATRAFLTLLRLPAETRLVFEERIAQAFPARAARSSRTSSRPAAASATRAASAIAWRASGPRWKAIEALFEVECRRLGFETGEHEMPRHTSTFRRPGPVQTRLFE